MFSLAYKFMRYLIIMTLLQMNLGLRTLHYIIITANQQEVSAVHPRDKEGDVVSHTGNPVTWEAEAGASIGLQG